MPVERAVAAIEESGAPMVSIAGGEPMMHPQIDDMVNELVKRKKYRLPVHQCRSSSAKRWDKFDFTPSPYFAFAIHIDGLRERHDESVAKEGVFDEAVAAITFLKEKGFRVTTNSTFFNTDTPQTIIDVLNFLNDEVKVGPDDDLAGLRIRKERPTRTISWASPRPGSCSPRPSPAGTASAGGSTTRRCSSTSSKERLTSSARRGASRRTRCSVGSARAI